MAIYSSPLERALETAVPLAQTLSLEITPRPGLIETDIGEWAGKTVKSLGRLKVWRTVQSSPPGYDSRAVNHFWTPSFAFARNSKPWAAQHDPKDLIACFSHADPIKAAIAHFTGVHLDLFQRIVVSPASVTAFAFGHHGVAMIKCNDTGGLNELVPPKSDPHEATEATEAAGDA